MSEDTFSQLVAKSIASNLQPLVGWLYAVFAAVALGTATLVGMWYDLKHAVAGAERMAVESKAEAAGGREEVRTLAGTVAAHSLELAVLKAQRARTTAATTTTAGGAPSGGR